MRTLTDGQQTIRPSRGYWLSTLVALPVADVATVIGANVVGLGQRFWFTAPLVLALGGLGLWRLPSLAHTPPGARAVWAFVGMMLSLVAAVALACALFIAWLEISCSDGGCGT